MVDLEELLNRFINGTNVWDGKVIHIKRLVDKIRNMKIEIYTNDHNPPHFHVKSNCLTINARFFLLDGSFWDGEISSDDKKRIEAFYKTGKSLLLRIWDETRPK